MCVNDDELLLHALLYAIFVTKQARGQACTFALFCFAADYNDKKTDYGDNRSAKVHACPHAKVDK